MRKAPRAHGRLLQRERRRRGRVMLPQILQETDGVVEFVPLRKRKSERCEMVSLLAFPVIDETNGVAQERMHQDRPICPTPQVVEDTAVVVHLPTEGITEQGSLSTRFHAAGRGKHPPSGTGGHHATHRRTDRCRRCLAAGRGRIRQEKNRNSQVGDPRTPNVGCQKNRNNSGRE